MKSANTDEKVLAPYLDFAEFVAFLTLYHICKEIESIYMPGARFLLYTQEPFLIEIDEVVQGAVGQPLHGQDLLDRYQHDLRELAGYFNPEIELRQIKNLKERYAQIPKQPRLFGPLTEKETNELTNIKTFMKQELLCQRFEDAARNHLFQALCKKQYPQLIGLTFKEFEATYRRSADKQQQKFFSTVSAQLQTKELLSTTSLNVALCYLQGAAVLRTILAQEMNNYVSCIRLAVKSADDISMKLGIAMIYGSRGTAWHNVPVVTADGFHLSALGKEMKNNVREYALGTLRLMYIQQDTIERGAPDVPVALS